MLNTKSFLCLDFGAGSLKAAEFESAESGVLRLRQFGIRSLGFEGSQDVSRERVLAKMIPELLAERGFGARTANACAPGYHVFSKFVKLPPVDASKVSQIIQYEAQQNVPFPLEEVAWDYQILGASPSGEFEVLLVAIKNDMVEGLFRAAETAGVRVQLVDVSAAALANAFRFNYGDLEGCSMLLDIGAKTSNLLFFEKGKVYARGINIGANSITQDFAAEGKMRFAEAEAFKVAEGFVSLGGAYEEPDNPKQAQISKIARQVMTRLHIQVNQTIQFYRGQQGGSAPQRLFLGGGASIMPYTAQFFAEKLNLAVEYFNPFRNIEIDPAVNLEELAGVAHAFGEVVGLGLRNVAQCPVEMNLMPKKFLKRQELSQKQPFFVAAVFSLVLGVLAFGGFYAKLVSLKQDALDTIASKSAGPRQTAEVLQRELQALDRLKAQNAQIHAWSAERFFWGDLLTELRTALIRAEVIRKADMGGVDQGIWLESFVSDNPILSAVGAPAPAFADAPAEPAGPQMDARMRKLLMERYGLDPTAKKSDPGSGGDVADAAPTAAGARPRSATNEVAVFNVTCRAVNLKKLDATANGLLAYELERQLQSSPLFDPKETRLSGPIDQADDAALTFTFGLTVKLKNPLKL
jgi:type IV pilus assembly protein PilM